MGLFGKMFDKKECDLCGGEIGLLGNRKLEDGNCCKDCAKKLSPFMTDRRQSTVEEIKQHIAYREKNAQLLGSINPTKVMGTDTKVYVDEAKGKFFVTRASDWRSGNPDIIDLTQVSSFNVDIKEDKQEMYRQNSEGKRESYNPPRYECSYRFMVEIHVNSPWFSEIEFELTDDRPDSPYTDTYRDYERQAQEMRLVLDPNENRNRQPIPVAQNNIAQGNAAKASDSALEDWTCSCGTKNTGNFCAQCGAKKPLAETVYRCNKCGWQPEDRANLPKFCPQCGDRFDEKDIV